MKEIDKEAYSWTLYETPEGRCVLSVLCGTVGLYEINIELDFDEKEQYMVAGRVYLEGLAAKVRNHPQAFRGRHVHFPAA